MWHAPARLPLQTAEATTGGSSTLVVCRALLRSRGRAFSWPLPTVLGDGGGCWAAAAAAAAAAAWRWPWAGRPSPLPPCRPLGASEARWPATVAAAALATPAALAAAAADAATSAAADDAACLRWYGRGLSGFSGFSGFSAFSASGLSARAWAGQRRQRWRG